MRIRRARCVTIAAICLFCLPLLVRDAADTFGAPALPASSLRFGYSVLVTVAFLAIGGLVWLYANQRLVALLLFGFTSTMAITFAVETGATSGDPLLSATTSISSLVAILFLDLLLLVFPRNALLWPRASTQAGALLRLGWRRFLVLALRGYLCALLLLCGLAIGTTVLRFLGKLATSSRLPLIISGYASLGLVGGLLSLYLAYRLASTLRERQQLRLLVWGGIVAIAPLLLLTLLPSLLGLPPQFVVDSQMSTATFVVLPLALGYSIVRYQILVFEASIRRVFVSLVGLFCLAVTAYLVIEVGEVLFPNDEPTQAGFVIFALVALGSGAWWFSRRVAERVFFSEIAHYRRIIGHPERLVGEPLDLDEAALLIVGAVIEAFETPDVGLYILDEEAGCFRPSSPFKESSPATTHLTRQLFAHARPAAVLDRQTDWLEATAPLVERLGRAARPLLLSELSRPEERVLPRLLSNTHSDEDDPLLISLKANGKLVGILLIGRRGDRQAYAGPDFEAIDLILSCFGPALEIARLATQARSYAALTMKLYTGLPRQPFDHYTSLEEVVRDYARVAASATSSGAEVWLIDAAEGEPALRRVLHIGSGPALTDHERVAMTELPVGTPVAIFSIWQPAAGFAQLHADPAPLELSAQASAAPADGGTFPYAWLPLVCRERLQGALALTFGRPHAFALKEQRLLELFAHQCAACLEGTSITLALGDALASQVKLAQRRDQFLREAARELRTPLTTIGGFIDLVCDHGAHLPQEARAEFLARAQRGSAELVLLVNHLLDAILPPTEREPLALSPVALAAAVRATVELRSGIIRSERREVRSEVSPALRVLADDLRLRQVLLHLLSLALAHSPPGSAIEIAASQEGEEVTVRMHDQGQSIPQERQAHLFTPFAGGDPEAGARVRGVGQGLYVCRQVLEAMGGRLWIERNVPGEAGNTFAFMLRQPAASRSAQEDALLFE